MSAGIYLHIPFCKQACHYCHFHFATNLKLKESMVDAMCKELIDSRALFANDTISSIYFAGGTPSLLSISDLQQLLFTIRNNYQVEENAEITLEANPDDMSIEKAQHWYDAGVNRLSIGIQSFKQEDLVWMNRAHNAKESLQCLQWAKQVGFENITIDLIYGIPQMTDEQWEENIEIAKGT